MCRLASIAPSEKNWVHCRPRPGSAVLIGVAFRRGLTGSTVKRAMRPPWLCILCQRACRNAQARISPNKKDDATTTAKQTGVHTLQHFLVDVRNGVPWRNSSARAGHRTPSLRAMRQTRSPRTRAVRIRSSRQLHRLRARASVPDAMCLAGAADCHAAQRDRPARQPRFVAVR
jgi:hypothetical protein